MSTFPCFVCGDNLQPQNRLAVTGHLPDHPAYRSVDPTVRLHLTCATHFAAQILAGLHSTEIRRQLVKPKPDLYARAGEAAGLTRSELRILEGLVRGETNQEIARRLGLAEKTIKNMVSNILYKLETRSRTEAAVLALRTGIIKDEALTGGDV